MARFLVEEEGRPTRSYRIVTEAIVIGRLDTADLVLPDTGVSRKHALVERVEGGWEVSDNGSANGTIVNGAAQERTALKHGDVVSIGKFTLIFQTDDEGELPEYTDPNAGAGDDHTSPGTAIDMDTLRALPDPGLPPAPVMSATLAPAPSSVAPPHLLGADGERFDIGERLYLGKDVPVSGVLPFVSPGRLIADGRSIRAERGSFLIPMYVNGASIQSCTLVEGDEVRVGSSRFVYHQG